MIQQKSNLSTNKLCLSVSIALIGLLSGCASVKAPTASFNPPPSEVFANFSDFELMPFDRTSSCEKQRGADVALDAVHAKLRVKLRQLFENWKASPTLVAGNRKLIVQPVCVEARLVSKGARFGMGFFGGDSGLVLNVRYTDAASGKVIAEPVFYQKTNVFSGVYSWGATDQAMLDRTASLITVYTATNYEKAVGGPTGLEVGTPQ